MGGNAWEWVDEYWHDNYTVAPLDGSARVTGDEQKLRVLRGGSWLFTQAFLRSDTRLRNTPDDRTYDSGFQLAMTF